jgi:hypothetical protein
MPYGTFTRQPIKRRLIKDIGDESHRTLRTQFCTVGRDDTARFLPAML